MARTLLSIDLDARRMILELVLISEHPIQPYITNKSKNNTTTPNFTNISRTCSQLRDEAKFIFFRKNRFFFESQSTPGPYGSLRGMTDYFSTSFLSRLKPCPTKLLMEHVILSWFDESDWFGNPCSYGRFNVITDAIEALKSTKAMRRLEFLIRVPSHFHLCDGHYKVFRQQENLPDITREREDGEDVPIYSEWAGHPHIGKKYEGPLYTETEEHDIGQHEWDRLFAYLETIRDLNVGAVVKFQVVSEMLREDYHFGRSLNMKQPGAYLGSRCHWQAILFFRESIMRLDTGYNMKQQKELLKSMGTAAQRISPYKWRLPLANLN